ncbi:MAG TPA: siderophore-interacting protein [Cellulomonas sp.]
MVARTNVNDARTRPEVTELLTLHVLRRELLTPSMARVTLGGGDVQRFRPLGYDQWFRLFLPVGPQGADSLTRLPHRLDTLSYLRYLAISRTTRPLLRNYTVRAHRPSGADGPEIDVDLVLHGSPDDGTSGPAATWAQTCAVGDAVAILDEGTTFSPAARHEEVLIVADESGLPAVAGILASMPAGSRGLALVEVGSAADRQELGGPAGVEVRWLVRDDPHGVPGVLALAAVEALPLPTVPFYGWAVGESALATGSRRHWVRAGVPKEDITFCGYWKLPRRR